MSASLRSQRPSRSSAARSAEGPGLGWHEGPNGIWYFVHRGRRTDGGSTAREGYGFEVEGLKHHATQGLTLKGAHAVAEEVIEQALGWRTVRDSAATCGDLLDRGLTMTQTGTDGGVARSEKRS